MREFGSRLISRRGFLLSAVAIGGGIVFGIPSAFRDASLDSDDLELLHWVLISPDNTVTIRIAQMEMGQGTTTAMAQLLAEELELDWRKIRTEFISSRRQRTPPLFRDAWTAASLGVKRSESVLRAAGAQIRTMLVEAAAIRMSVPAAHLIAADSAVIHPATGQRLTYGELAADAVKLTVPHPDSLRLKTPSEWKLIGKAVERLDVPDKTNGKAVFGIDVSIPGMKYAAVAMCPVFGGRVISYDAAGALSGAGVHKVLTIANASAVAVIADDWWHAKAAVDAMRIEWAFGAAATVDSQAIQDNLETGLTGEADETLRNDGDVEAAIASASQRLETDYFVPYLEHAAMEPMNCTALVETGHFEVWAPTQNPQGSFEAAAKAAGMSIHAGTFHVTLLGGGFGRRQNTDYVSQAVEIAKSLKGTPIKLLWSREDTTRHSFYRPISMSRLRGALDSQGNVTAWSHRVVARSVYPLLSTLGSDSLLYAIPNMSVDRVVRGSHVPEGPMRGVAFSTNCFITQSFIDELAVAAGADSYQFQRRLLDPARVPRAVPKGQLLDDMTPSRRAERLRAVLDEVAVKSGWGEPRGPNQGHGIAVNEEANAYYAAVVEVTLDGKGWFSIDRVVIAVDPGFLVNPTSADAQVEGSVAFGLTSALYGEITIREGAVVEGNFHDYALLRINEMPRVDIHWILSGQFWGGVGEPAATVIVPALTNALYNAGGPRVRSLPLKNHRILSRLA